MSNYHKKTTDQNYRRRVPKKKKSVVPNKLVESLSINGAKYEGTYQYPRCYDGLQKAGQ